MITFPITEKSRQEEWKAIHSIAKNNRYPVNTINDLRTKLTVKKHQQYPLTIPHDKKWVIFTYISPMVRRITILFKHSNLNINFIATNTVQQQLCER